MTHGVCGDLRSEEAAERPMTMVRAFATMAGMEFTTSNRHPGTATIEISCLTKRFGSVTAVDNVSFTVEQGSVVGFLGPNGAGKTTTLRMLLGLVAPTGGTATINGRSYRELPGPRHVVGAVLE